MRVKPSHHQLATRIGMALLASVSLSACQSSGGGMGDLWRDIQGERKPQTVSGQRRVPMLNRAPTKEVGGAPQATSYPQTQSAQTAKRAQTAPARSFSNAYENQPEYQQPANQEEPYLLDRAVDWFSSQFDSPTPTNPIEPASNQTMALANHAAVGAPIIPIDQHEPLASHPVAIAPQETDAQLAKAMLPIKITPQLKDTKTLRSTDEVLSMLETAPPPPMQIASAPKQEIVLPWGNDKPLNTPIPQTPTTPNQLSALMPAAGGRKGQTDLSVDEVSDEEFATIIDESNAPTASTELASSEIGMGGPLFESANEADGEETLLASSSSMELAANDAEYPPLNSVPQVPTRIQEIRREHPVVKQELETGKIESDLAREQVQKQIEEEADESLLNSTPESTLAPAAGGMGMLVALPPVQFSDARWSGPRIVTATAKTTAIITPVAHLIKERVPVAENESMMEKVMDSISILPTYISLPVLNEQREVAYQPLHAREFAL